MRCSNIFCALRYLSLFVASALHKHLHPEYSHSVHSGVSYLLAVVSSPAHQHAPQECMAVPGPSLGPSPTLPAHAQPSTAAAGHPGNAVQRSCGWPSCSTRPSFAEAYVGAMPGVLALYQAFLRRGLPGSYAWGSRALPGLPSPRPTWELCLGFLRSTRPSFAEAYLGAMPGVLALYQAFLRRGLPGSYAWGSRALPGLPSPRPTWKLCLWYATAFCVLRHLWRVRSVLP